MRVNIPVEPGNQAARTGKLGATIQSILADLKPEAVYFTDDKGQRTAFLFLEMKDASPDPGNCRAAVPGVACEHRDSPGNDTGGSRQGQWLDRSGRQEVQLIAPVQSISNGPPSHRRLGICAAAPMDKVGNCLPRR